MLMAYINILQNNKMQDLIIKHNALIVTDYVPVENVNFELTGEWTGVQPHRWILPVTQIKREIKKIILKDSYFFPFSHHVDPDGTFVIDAPRGKKTETIIRYIEYINSSKKIEQQANDYMDQQMRIAAFKRFALAIKNSV
jgi:hypothetical protein